MIVENNKVIIHNDRIYKLPFWMALKEGRWGGEPYIEIVERWRVILYKASDVIYDVAHLNGLPYPIYNTLWYLGGLISGMSDSSVDASDFKFVAEKSIEGFLGIE